MRTKIPQRLQLLHPRRRTRNPHPSQPIDWRRRLSQFHRAILRLLRDLHGCGDIDSRHDRESGKNPSQRARTKPGKRPQSGKAARPAKKESRMPQELLIFAYRAVVRENSVRLQNQQDTLRPRYLDEFWWGTPKHPLSFGENGVRNYWGPQFFYRLARAINL